MAVSPSETAELLLECVCEALSNAGRPVCKCYQTVGTPVILTCCDCDEDDYEANGELSLHFRRIFDADPQTLLEVQRVRPCKGGVTAAQYRLVLARCFPTIDDQGNLPDQETLEQAAADQHEDVDLMWQALACCTGLNIRVDSITIDLGPKSTCALYYADVTVEVRVPALPVAESL